VTDSGTPRLTRYRHVVITCGAPVGTTCAPVQDQSHAASFHVRFIDGVLSYKNAKVRNVQFSIVSLNGKINALCQQLIAPGDGCVRWRALEKLAQGTYLLEIKDGNSQSVARIVK
jgi:hypothetical protein